MALDESVQIAHTVQYKKCKAKNSKCSMHMLHNQRGRMVSGVAFKGKPVSIVK
jgi:hypothetical protein